MENPKIEYFNIGFNGFISSIQIDNKVYLVNNTNEIYCYNLKLMQMKIITKGETKFCCIDKRNGNELIIMDTEGNVYLFYIEQHQLKRMNLKIEHCNSIAFVKNRLYAFPMKNGRGYYLIDFEKMSVEFKKIQYGLANEELNKVAFSQTFCYNDKVFVNICSNLDL